MRLGLGLGLWHDYKVHPHHMKALEGLWRVRVRVRVRVGVRVRVRVRVRVKS